VLLCLAAADARASDDPSALARKGTAAIENQRFGEALEAFTRAAALEPGDASFCFGAGVAAFMLGQDALAQSRFECALALNPAYLPAATWLGDLHYRAGRIEEAISIYETARRHAPDRPELQKQLAIWRTEQALQSRFREVRTNHFTALYETAADEPLARKIVERLEAAYRRVGETLGVYPSHRITVVLYTREQFVEITKLATWSVAAYDGRIRVPISDALKQRDELDRVLTHEYVHAVVGRLGGRALPAWVNEGLATALEPSGAENSDTTTSLSRARPGLSQLHRGFVGLSRREAEVAYASAAAAMQRLLEQRGAPAVVSLLEDVARGVPFASAFRHRIGMPYEDFAALAARD
jgi:tetratricopeptide (TPR) repeat protein